MARHTKFQQTGFSLIEILVSIVVLAIALAALAKFQGGLMRGGGEARSRSVAVGLAEEKLNDLRSFSEINGTDSSVFYYAEIGSNTGGLKEADNSLPLPSGPVDSDRLPDANAVYNLNWSVVDSADSVGAQPTYKDVTVAVSWTDQSGIAQSVSLSGKISASSPAAAARAANQPEAQAQPIVRKTPGAAPDVIAIPLKLSLGSGLTKESSKPEPDIIAQAGTTITYFDEVVYDTSLASGGSSPIVNRDEFLTVNCVCVQGNAAGDSSTGNAFLPVKLEPGAHLWTLVNDDGDGAITSNDMVAKRIGYAATGHETVGGESLQLNAQPTLCTPCCRDHHDQHHDGSETLDSQAERPYQFDPFRSHDATIDGDHKHFFPDNSGVLQPADDLGDLYLEACRFVRADGQWRVAPDWRLESLQLLPASELTDDGGSGTTGLNHYKDYVTQFVVDYVDSVIGMSSTYPGLTPEYYQQLDPKTTAVDDDFSSVFDTELATLRNKEDSGDEYDLAVNASSTLLARAVYMDYMNEDLVSLLDCKSDDSDPRPTGCENIAYDDSYLALVPFHEVNVTGLANWSWTENHVNITDEPIADDDRGRVTGVSSGCSDAIVQIERSNTGLTDTKYLDNLAESNHAEDDSLLEDRLAVDVANAGCGGAPTATATIGGSLSIAGGVSNVAVSDIIITSTGVLSNCQTFAATETWQCDLTGPGSTSLTISNYTSKNNDGTCKADTQVVGTGILSGVPPTITSDATISETTNYVFGISYTGTPTLTFDINISKESGAAPCAGVGG